MVMPSANGAVTMEDVLPMLLWLVGVAGIGVVLTMSIRGRIAKRRKAIPTPRERITETRLAARTRAESNDGEASMLDLARRLASQLDTKAERLEQLIVTAEQRAVELEALIEAEPIGPTVVSGRGLSAPAVPRRTIRAVDPLHEAVYALADRGSSPVEIARELDEHTGKVELILALREAAV